MCGGERETHETTALPRVQPPGAGHAAQRGSSRAKGAGSRAPGQHGGWPLAAWSACTIETAGGRGSRWRPRVSLDGGRCIKKNQGSTKHLPSPWQPSHHLQGAFQHRHLGAGRRGRSVAPASARCPRSPLPARKPWLPARCTTTSPAPPAGAWRPGPRGPRPLIIIIAVDVRLRPALAPAGQQRQAGAADRAPAALRGLQHPRHKRALGGHAHGPLPAPCDVERQPIHLRAAGVCGGPDEG